MGAVATICLYIYQIQILAFFIRKKKRKKQAKQTKQDCCLNQLPQQF